MPGFGEYGEPRYYAYRSHHILDTKLFDIPFQERWIVLLEFDIMSDVADPNVEPVLIYHYAGMRRYLWRNVYWGETEIQVDQVRKCVSKILKTCKDEQEEICLYLLVEAVNAAQDSPAPHPDDNKPIKLNAMQRMIQSAFPGMLVDPEEARAKKWCRAIYRVNQ